MSHSLSLLLVGIVSRVVVPPVGLGLEEVVYIYTMSFIDLGFSNSLNL